MDSESVECEIARPNVIRVSSNLDRIELHRVPKPGWCTRFGTDSFGAYAVLRVNAAEPVEQTLRWIPPGRFMMGSPEDESGRYNDEQQHAVLITRGYWMFNTPCTQALWMAVMDGDNPSHFLDPERPVEQVSWEDATQFGKRLSESVGGELEFRLPSEAEWEYACRAGTTGAIYHGEFKILSEANAPALDSIAWYGGNSGHEYDHEVSENSPIENDNTTLIELVLGRWRKRPPTLGDCTIC